MRWLAPLGSHPARARTADAPSDVGRFPRPAEKEEIVSGSDSDRIDSEETQLPKRSWLSRLRVAFLMNAIPYYEKRRADQGDDEVTEAAIRSVRRKGRTPDDVMQDSIDLAKRKGRLPEDFHLE